MSPQQHTIPTPFPVGAVHCYSFERDDELILVDCGPPTTEARDYLQQHIDLERLQQVGLFSQLEDAFIDATGKI